MAPGSPGLRLTVPIVDVEVVGSIDHLGLAQQLAETVGAALASPPGGTWVRLRTLDAESYAEDADDQPEPLPVFVTILARRLPDDLEHVTSRLTHSLAPLLDRPPNRIHIEWSPPAAGRLFFGGHLVD